MWRRIKQILLPGLIILAATLFVTLAASVRFQSEYRSRSNQETAQLVGLVLQEHPDLDATQVVQILRGEADPHLLQEGSTFLSTFGYDDRDYATQSAGWYGSHVLCLFIIALCLSLILLLAYFWFLDWRQERRIMHLVEYLQRLKDRLYDLKLDENTEEHFSLLTNELYKITVVLKEAAECNRQQRHNLETALEDISHQLRTPLTSLQVMVDNIYDDPKMPVAVRQDFLRTMSRQVENMSYLVTTLLHLAQFDNASIKLQHQTATVRKIFNQVRTKLDVLADLHNVRLKFAGDLDTELVVDLRWQTEALTNIVKNCIEHSPADSKVIMRAESCALYTKIIIQDTGEGISLADQRHIFERFYKTKNSQPGSIGIGLSFAKAIIEADQGQISVHSTEKVGTKFTITYYK